MYVDEYGCADLYNGKFFVVSRVMINECNLDGITLQISQYLHSVI